jgi:chemosensory pili system protein ChpB (putative protein-glutamate methylesterase)
MKTTVAQRVVIMGRDGQARDCLVAALTELGVVPVWIGKPAQSNPERLSELNANKIIISLEPTIEPELEPYSDFLSRQAITVLYDDAEITSTLSGWDLQRWARHLAAKVLGRDVMPLSSRRPDPEPAETTLSDDSADIGSMPGWNEMPHKLADHPEGMPGQSAHSAWQDTGHYDELEIDSQELNAALEKLNQSLSAGFNPAEILELSFEQKPDSDPPITSVALAERAISKELEFDFDAFNSTMDLVPMAEGDLADAEQTGYLKIDGLSIQDVDGFAEEQRVSNRNEVHAEREEAKVLHSDADYASFFSSLTNQTEQIPSYDLSKFSLVEEVNAGVAGNEYPESQDLDRKSMFLVISGLGGPVAVRALLGQVTPGFGGILAIAHDINPEQLPKLREQFQKLTEIPIILPEAEEFLKTGNIYLLPRKHTLQSTSLGYQCIAGASLAGFIDQMDHAAEILVLSGADPMLAQQLIQIGEVASNIHVQPPEDCYEPTLSQILVNVGAPVIDQDLMAQWFNQ